MRRRGGEPFGRDSLSPPEPAGLRLPPHGASGRGGPLGSGDRERSGGAGSGPRGGRLYLSRFRKMVLVSVYWSWDSRPLSLPPNPESL